MPKTLFRKPKDYGQAPVASAEPPSAAPSIEQQAVAQHRTVAELEQRLAGVNAEIEALEADYRSVAAGEARGGENGHAAAIRARIVGLEPRRDGLVEAVAQENARMNTLAHEGEQARLAAARKHRRAEFDRLAAESDALAADLAAHIEVLSAGLNRQFMLGQQLQDFAELGGPSAAERARERVLQVRPRLANAGWRLGAGLQISVVAMYNPEVKNGSR